MARVALLLADGFEEIEAVTVVDVLRRADVEVTIAGLADGPRTGSHGISVATDARIEDVRAEEYDAVVLPGGLPGATNLRDDERVQALLGRFAAADRIVAAICAGPIALDRAGVLRGKRATSYPGFELPSAGEHVEDRVVADGKVVTSRGPGTALEFAYELVRRLAGAEVAEGLEQRMLFRRG